MSECKVFAWMASHEFDPLKSSESQQAGRRRHTSPEMQQAIEHLLDTTTLTQRQIAERLGVNRHRVDNVVRARRRRDPEGKSNG